MFLAIYAAVAAGNHVLNPVTANSHLERHYLLQAGQGEVTPALAGYNAGFKLHASSAHHTFVHQCLSYLIWLQKNEV